MTIQPISNLWCGADFAMTKKLTRAGLHGFFSRIAERIPVML